MPAWSLVFLGKAMASFVLLLIVELVSLPVYGLFNNLQWVHAFWGLFGVMILATWGITITGVAFSAVTVNVKLRELMPRAALSAADTAVDRRDADYNGADLGAKRAMSCRSCGS